MAEKKKTDFMFWATCVVVLGAVALIVHFGSGGGAGTTPTAAPVVAQKRVAPVQKAEPRNTAPMEELTPYFRRLTYPVRREELSFDLTYYMYQPQKPWPEGIKFPLVLVLHGAPGNAYAAKYLLGRDMRLQFPAFILAPVLPKGVYWHAPNSIPGHPKYDVAAKTPKGLPGTMDLIAELVQELPIDQSRIYVIGCSEGGVGAFGAVHDYANIIAASVSISGGWSVNDSQQFLKTPMLVMHGALDSVMHVDLSRRISLDIKRRGGSLEYIEFATMDHNCPAPHQYSIPMWKWLFSQKKPIVTGGQ